MPSDPRGNAFNYEYPGKRSSDASKPAIWSSGPDGKDGTGDDIRNWEPGSAHQAVDDRAATAASENSELAEDGDEFDKLYRMRIRIWTEMNTIYKSVDCQNCANIAAEELRGLMPLEFEVKELETKPGLPGEQRRTELSKKYDPTINQLENSWRQLSHNLEKEHTRCYQDRAR